MTGRTFLFISMTRTLSLFKGKNIVFSLSINFNKGSLILFICVKILLFDSGTGTKTCTPISFSATAALTLGSKRIGIILSTSSLECIEIMLVSHDKSSKVNFPPLSL